MLDLALVVAPANRGWVLDTIAKEIAARAPGTSEIHYGGDPLPAARCYFFTHYSLFVAMRRERVVRDAASVVFFTHPGHARWQTPLVARRLARADAVVSMSTLFARYLTRWGVPRSKVHVALPGADPARFTPHARGGNAVGLSSAYYARKRPDRVVGIVRAMPHRAFVLVGKGWREAPEFGALSALPNFTYDERPYEEYPSFYDGVDVFVSPAALEGGPIPLIEAMMANVVPVATRTGFAPDVVRHGENGYMCDVDAPVEVLCELVEQAFSLTADVRSTVEHLTWDAFAAAVSEVVDAVSGQRR